MLFYEFKVGDNVYKLRLTTRDIISLEKVIGTNPINIFGVDGKTVPPVTVMVNILHQSLQKYQHGLTLNDAYDIFDAYMEDGHMPMEFMADILELYRVSGIIRDVDANVAPQEEETKN